MLVSAGLLSLMLMVAFAADTSAELSLDDTRALLQESLTISEIDREVERLSGEEVIVGEQIQQTQAAIVQQSDTVERTRRHAGKVLRSYYMGERDQLWLLMLQTDNFA